MIASPVIVAEAPVLDNPLMTLLVKVIPDDVLEQVIPVTLPPVPVEDKLLIVLDATVMDVALFVVEPIVTAMMAA